MNGTKVSRVGESPSQSCECTSRWSTFKKLIRSRDWLTACIWSASEFSRNSNFTTTGNRYTIEDCPAHSLVFGCKCQCVLGWRVCPNNDNIIRWCCRPCHNCNFYGVFFFVATTLLLFAATEYLLVLSVFWSVGRKRAFQWSNLQASFNIHGHTKGPVPAAEQVVQCYWGMPLLVLLVPSVPLSQ